MKRKFELRSEGLEDGDDVMVRHFDTLTDAQSALQAMEDNPPPIPLIVELVEVLDSALLYPEVRS